jgi:hypothetical protein
MLQARQIGKLFMISCLIVNFNCLFHTKNLINDLERQNISGFELIVIDQNSVEDGTADFLNNLKSSKCKVKIIKNTYNKPLNQIWNEFTEMASFNYCAFLNNDIRIPKNFLSDTIKIFDKEPLVYCVIHPTNHSAWTTATQELTYDIPDDKTRQGWDFSFRKDQWVNIPSCLDFYCGDDFIFENLYEKHGKVAIATSSPIIHLLSQTRKSPLNKVIPNRNPNKDIENYKALGYKHYLNLLDKYSKIHPEIDKITEE